MRGKSRCHWHGGRNGGAPKGNTYALVHGRRSKAAEQAARAARAEAKAAEAVVAAAVQKAEKLVSPPKRRGRPKKVKPDGAAQS